jgi:hypothetical protein
MSAASALKAIFLFLQIEHPIDGETNCEQTQSQIAIDVGKVRAQSFCVERGNDGSKFTYGGEHDSTRQNQAAGYPA